MFHETQLSWLYWSIWKLDQDVYFEEIFNKKLVYEINSHFKYVDSY